MVHALDLVWSATSLTSSLVLTALAVVLNRLPSSLALDTFILKTEERCGETGL